MTTRDIDEIVTDVIKSNIAKIYTSIPGRFESFDGELASVKPLIKKKYIDDEIEALPVIVGVPVLFPSTNEFQMTFPINKGDGCLIIFSMRDISNWIANGGDSEPVDLRKYDITDAMAIPGLFSPIESTIEYDEDDVLIKFNEAVIRIQKDEKFAIGNQNAELIDILSQLLAILKTDTAGGSPLAGAAQYAALQLTVDNFLKGLV